MHTEQLSMGAQIGQSGSVEIVGLSENKIGTHLTLLGWVKMRLAQI